MTLADELQAMLLKAQRYVDSARVLQAEGDHDSAVSRLYYAMFYCAEALMVAKGQTFSSHKAVISAFGQHYAKTGLLPKHLHQWLREAFEKRQLSDYDFVLTASKADVDDLKTKAEQFIAATREFFKREGTLP